MHKLAKSELGSVYRITTLDHPVAVSPPFPKVDIYIMLWQETNEEGWTWGRATANLSVRPGPEGSRYRTPGSAYTPNGRYRRLLLVKRGGYVYGGVTFTTR